ncbi:MAG: ribbon-helix-helix protein, CopG family [Thermoanaerobaculia bacterium]
MAASKRKTVFTAEPAQLERIREIVESGRYRTSSELIREAIDEKLERVRQDLLAEQVATYCDCGFAGEDEELIDLQAFDRDE